jgi:hypothetical protein
MATAAELRAEAQRLRDFALTVTDEEVLDQLQAMILELERRARKLENGDGLGSIERHATHDLSRYPARRQTLQRRDDQPHG